MKKLPAPMNEKERIKYNAKKPIIIFKAMLLPNVADRTNCFHSSFRNLKIM
jgi:hypothetical protein